MKKNLKSMLIVIFSIIFLLVGCSSGKSSKETSEESGQAKTITDSAGKKSLYLPIYKRLVMPGRHIMKFYAF